MIQMKSERIMNPRLLECSLINIKRKSFSLLCLILDLERAVTDGLLVRRAEAQTVHFKWIVPKVDGPEPARRPLELTL